MTRPGWLVVLLATAGAVAACGEEPQTQGSQKVDMRAWEGAVPAYSAGNWKRGDAAAWEEQLKKRAQHQNEYGRMAP